jgi:hypothetical protein
MDISEARYCGMSLCWRSSVGDLAPSFYDARGEEWLRTFSGGLLTTCGLTQVGDPESADGEELGLHGRISACPAERVSLSEQWEGDDRVLSVSGTVREGRLYGHVLEMHRTIRATADGAAFALSDRIVNAGARTAPCMLLYHINIGFPLLDEGTELIAPSGSPELRTTGACLAEDGYTNMQGPSPDYREREYTHTMQPDSEGRVTVAVINRRLADGIGLRLRYQHRQLPCFNEWRRLTNAEYVLGIEPGTCLPLGRTHERQAGRLLELDAGQEISAGFEIDIVEGTDAVAALARQAARVTT